MASIQRQLRDHSSSIFVSKYKQKYYYWELVLFMRRISIAMFSVSAIDNNYKVIFMMILFIFLFAQIQGKLFMIQSGNVMGIILSSCFMFMVFLDSIFFINDIFKTYLISFLVIFPLILLYTLYHRLMRCVVHVRFDIGNTIDAVICVIFGEDILTKNQK